VTLGILGLALMLLVHDVSREIEIARLRSNLVSGVSHELKTPWVPRARDRLFRPAPGDFWGLS